MKTDEYNENEVLRKYVLTYYSEYFTELESIGFKAILAEEKAQNASPSMADKLREKWGAKNNPEVVAALSEGSDKFNEAVFQRLMSEHGNDIFINRCPKCKKIAKTPKAKQCPWCFHDWH